MNCQDSVTYLYPPGGGQPGVCYTAGTKICLSCPLQTRPCRNKSGEPDLWPCVEADSTALPDVITCLNAYTVNRLAGLITGGHWRVRALKIGDRLARCLDPDDPESAAAFRQAVDDYAELLEAAAGRLEPFTNGRTAAVLADIAGQTLEQGMSRTAFNRAVEVWADRLAFMAGVQRQREAA